MDILTANDLIVAKPIRTSMTMYLADHYLMVGHVIGNPLPWGKEFNDKYFTEKIIRTGSILTKTPPMPWCNEGPIKITFQNSPFQEQTMCCLQGFRRHWIFSISLNDAIVLLCVGFVCLFSFSCYSLPAPFFSVEAIKKGVSTTTVGILYGLFEFVVFILSLVFGKYATHFGCKKVFFVGILLSGISTVAVGCTGYLDDKYTFIVCCFIVRILEGVGAAASLTTSYTFAAKLFPKHVPFIMGLLEMCNGLGLMVGPSMGSGLYEAGGFGLPFFTTGALLLIIGVLCLYNSTKFPEGDTQHKGTLTHILKRPDIVIAGMGVMVAASGIGFLEPTLAEHLNQLNLPMISAGGFFVLLPLVYAVSSPLWGFVNDKWGCGRSLMIISLFLAFVSFVLIGPTPVITAFESSVIQLVLSSILFGVTMSGIIVPSIPYILQKLARDIKANEEETYSLVSGFISASFSLGAFIGPMLGGVMVDKLLFPLATSVYAFLFLLVALITTITAIVDKCLEKPISTLKQNGSMELAVINITDRSAIIKN